ncbi:MAG: helix-turn-helix transcriptional regulator, partial [bacterium]
VLISRELQVYSYLQKGMTNSEIADLLNISPKTIGTYKNRLMQKLGLVSSRELNEHMKIYGVGL